MDDEAHNEETRRLWAAYRAGKPFRAPVTFTISTSSVLFDPKLNPEGYSPRQYYEDPEIQWKMAGRLARHIRFNVPQDLEMGPPETWAPLWVDFGNTWEAQWFGCETYFTRDAVIDTHPMFLEKKEKLYDTPKPDPISGNNLKRGKEVYELFEAKRKTELLEGRPMGKTGVHLGHDGPFTMACNLRGATETCEDMMTDEKYFHDLMDFIVEGAIRRIKAWRQYSGYDPSLDDTYWFADDSISLISPAQYRQHVLPYHLRLMNEFRAGRRMLMHLCGRVQHLIGLLVKELKVDTFEVGFPLDLGKARADAGEKVEFIGNISPMLLKNGPAPAIREAVKAACASGVMTGGRFILHDGHNCAPGTPLEHFAAMYEAGKEYGKY